jgi:hypothetical protein
MKKQHIFLIAVALLAGIYFISSAINQKKQSDDILAKFNEVNNQLKSSLDSLSALRAISDVSGDTLVIYGRSAVMYQPDSIRLEQFRKRVGEEDYRIGLDDNLNLLHQSEEYLTQKNCPVINAGTTKYLRFVLNDRSSQLVNLQKVENLWGIILFDPSKAPRYADISDMEEEYEVFFK